MEFESFKRERPEINLSALIDIVFILVIFVVLAANFQRIRGIDVNLPEAEATAMADDKALALTVPKSGPILIDGEPVEEAAVKQRLTELRKKYKTAVLLADGDVALARAVKLLSFAQNIGYQGVSIATQEGGN